MRDSRRDGSRRTGDLIREGRLEPRIDEHSEMNLLRSPGMHSEMNLLRSPGMPRGKLIREALGFGNLKRDGRSLTGTKRAPRGKRLPLFRLKKPSTSNLDNAGKAAGFAGVQTRSSKRLRLSSSQDGRRLKRMKRSTALAFAKCRRPPPLPRARNDRNDGETSPIDIRSEVEDEGHLTWAERFVASEMKQEKEEPKEETDHETGFYGVTALVGRGKRLGGKVPRTALPRGKRLGPARRRTGKAFRIGPGKRPHLPR